MIQVRAKGKVLKIVGEQKTAPEVITLLLMIWPIFKVLLSSRTKTNLCTFPFLVLCRNNGIRYFCARQLNSTQASCLMGLKHASLPDEKSERLNVGQVCQPPSLGTNSKNSEIQKLHLLGELLQEVLFILISYLKMSFSRHKLNSHF